MRINELKQVLPTLLKAGITPNLVGHFSSGKTQGIKQFCADNGVEFRSIRLGQLSDAGDMTGMPIVKGNETHFMPSHLLPRSGKGILLMDEWNRTRKDILQVGFELAEWKRLNNYELPNSEAWGNGLSGWYVIFACNPDDDEYSVVDTRDPALVSRFCHISIEPDVSEFLKYGESIGLHEDVLGFLAEHPEHFHVYAGKPIALDYVKPSSRGYAAVSALRHLGLDNFEVFSGLIGFTSAAVFKEASQQRRITVESILAGKAKPTDKHAVLGLALEQLCAVESLSEKQATNVVKFLKACPADLAYASIIKLFPAHETFRQAANTDKEFIKLVRNVRKAA